MPLSDKEKTEARAGIALALELNEPESMIENLRRLCERKAAEAGEWAQARGYALSTDSERNRWRNAANALESVSKELERANAPQTRAKTDEGAQDTPSAA